jgi:hypothetical protein
MEIFIIILMSSLIGIVVVEDLLHIPQKIHSEYILVDIIIQLLRCPLCFSYWVTGFSWLIWFGTGWGFYFGFITYILTFLIKKYLVNVF